MCSWGALCGTRTFRARLSPGPSAPEVASVSADLVLQFTEITTCAFWGVCTELADKGVLLGSWRIIEVLRRISMALVM